jgi:hypothetical protein
MIERIRISLASLNDAHDRLPKEVKGSGVNTSLALGAAVVRGMLGEGWAEKRVYPSKRNRGFLTVNESSPEAIDLSAYKIIDLEELLFNLQHVPGFDECVDRMRRGDFEGTYAELDFGRMLNWNNIQFQYVVPTGTKRSSYDVDIILPGVSVRLVQMRNAK